MRNRRLTVLTTAVGAALPAAGLTALAAAGVTGAQPAPGVRTAAAAVRPLVTTSSPQWAGIRGSSIQLFKGTRYDTPVFSTALYNLRATGANAVSLVVQIGQQTIPSDTRSKNYKRDLRSGFDDSSSVGANKLTPVTSELRHAIVAAHNAGLKVMLDVHVETLIKNGWRGRIQPLDLPHWFAAYQKQLTNYATLAQQTHVEYFELGTELCQISGAPATGRTKARSQQLEQLWETLIIHVRNVYKGKLVYIAQWDGRENANVHFLKYLDYFGIGGYKPLTAPDTPYSQSQALAALASWDRTVVKPLLNLVRQQHSRAQLLLGEFGYRSIAGADRSPSDYTNTTGTYDPGG